MKTPYNFSSPILESFENLGAINGTALVDVKPFRDWKDSKWRNKIFTFRLCNSGEGLDVLEEVSKVSEEARAQMMKFQILARAIFLIDGASLVSPDELSSFNQKNSLNYDVKDYLIQWFVNTEQIVLDRLDAVYGALQKKQIRQLQGSLACDNCLHIFLKFPEGARKILYSVNEIICDTCLKSIDESLYDFDIPSQTSVSNISSEIPKESPEEKVITCPHCQKELPSYEEYQDHLTECSGIPI